MDNNIDHPLTLTVEQAATLLGIARSTAYELVATGGIPSLRLGRRIVVPLGQLAERLGVASDQLRRLLTTDGSSQVAEGGPQVTPPTEVPEAQGDVATLF